MVYGEELFISFCTRLTGVFSFGHCSQADLARLASYFWNRFSDYYKTQWKLAAARYNVENQLTGKRKRRGFWQFAIALEDQMLRLQTVLYQEAWQNMRPEERLRWMSPADTLVTAEVDHIQKAIDNLTL